jgi:hypothetical protein
MLLLVRSQKILVKSKTNWHIYLDHNLLVEPKGQSNDVHLFEITVYCATKGFEGRYKISLAELKAIEIAMNLIFQQDEQRSVILTTILVRGLPICGLRPNHVVCE